MEKNILKLTIYMTKKIIFLNSLLLILTVLLYNYIFYDTTINNIFLIHNNDKIFNYLSVFSIFITISEYFFIQFLIDKKTKYVRKIIDCVIVTNILSYSLILTLSTITYELINDSIFYDLLDDFRLFYKSYFIPNITFYDKMILSQRAALIVFIYLIAYILSCKTLKFFFKSIELKKIRNSYIYTFSLLLALPIYEFILEILLLIPKTNYFLNSFHEEFYFYSNIGTPNIDFHETYTIILIQMIPITFKYLLYIWQFKSIYPLKYFENSMFNDILKSSIMKINLVSFMISYIMITIFYMLIK